MRNSRVNSITYGAIICALVGVLLFVNRQLAGMFNEFLFWIIPLPVIVYSLKFSSKEAILVCVVMTLLSFLVAEPASVFYVFASAIAGLVYGWGMNKQRGALFLIGSVTAVSLIIMYITTILFAEVFGYASFAQQIAEFRDLFFQMGEQMLGKGASLDMFLQMIQGDKLIELMLIASIITSVMEGVLVHFLAFLVLKRLKMTLPPVKPFITIQAPLWMKLFVVGSYLAYYVAQLTSNTQYDKIIMPLYVISAVLCFVFGYLYILTLASLLIPNKAIRILVTMAVLLFAYFLIPFFGLYDMLFSARQKMVGSMQKVTDGKENG